MRWQATLLLLAAAIIAAAAPPPETAPAAQAALTLFSDRFYRGETLVFRADEGDIRPAFAPRSVRSVGRWLVCSEPRFRGRCIEIAGDYPIDTALGVNFNIRSLRAMVAGTGAGHPPPNVPPDGASLTGLSSRYFPAPAFGRERLLACPDGAPGMGCAKDTAQDLCRRAGYREAKHFVLQAERGLYYLADVLCVRTGTGENQ